MLKRSVLIAMALLSAGSVMAEEGGIALLPAGTDIANTESLQRGARNFMNYCSGCHSLKYLRFNRLAADLKIPESQLGNLMFTTDRPSTPSTGDAERFRGLVRKQPPDLSLIARAKGPDYLIHSSAVSRRQDPPRQNNLYLPIAAYQMCWRRCTDCRNRYSGALADEKGAPDGAGRVEPTTRRHEAREIVVRDIVNFLDYAGEPVKDKRQSIGVFVTLFLLVFFVFAYLLKKEYWKDVH